MEILVDKIDRVSSHHQQFEHCSLYTVDLNAKHEKCEPVFNYPNH